MPINIPEPHDKLFWRRVEKTPACWIWKGDITWGGYGIFTVTVSKNETRTLSAHRFSYKLHKGPIPAGLTIDHLCRNRSCANPEHLEAVTMRENILRGESSSANNARKQFCKRGHPLKGTNLYLKQYAFRQERICRECRRHNDKKLYWQKKQEAPKVGRSGR